MRKMRPLLLLLMLLIIPGLPVTVSAHPGSTDSNGGHWVQGSSEYHYHHGYSAHDHFDMDSDGIIDCPYSFDDKTGINSWAKSSKSFTSNGDYSSSRKSTMNLKPGDNRQVKYISSTVTYIPQWVHWTIGILCLIVVILILVIRVMNRTLDEHIQKSKQDAEAEEKRVREGLTALHTALQAQYGNDYLYVLAGAAEDDCVDINLLPYTVDSKNNPDNDRYVFYWGGLPIRNSSLKYHEKSCRYANPNYPVNAHMINTGRDGRPCLLCCKNIPNTDWVVKYQKYYRFMSKYVDISVSRILE